MNERYFPRPKPVLQTEPKSPYKREVMVNNYHYAQTESLEWDAVNRTVAYRLSRLDKQEEDDRLIYTLDKQGNRTVLLNTMPPEWMEPPMHIANMLGKAYERTRTILPLKPSRIYFYLYPMPHRLHFNICSFVSIRGKQYSNAGKCELPYAEMQTPDDVAQAFRYLRTTLKLDDTCNEDVGPRYYARALGAWIHVKRLLSPVGGMLYRHQPERYIGQLDMDSANLAAAVEREQIEPSSYKVLASHPPFPA